MAKGVFFREFIWIFSLVTLATGQNSLKPGVEILKAEPDYRSVKLQWKYQPVHYVRGFKVTLCETPTWRIKYSCKQRTLRLNTSQKNSHDFIVASTNGTYKASLYELRMLTNYTISISPLTSDKDQIKPRYDIGAIESNSITVTTKGFSARTTRCLGNVTDIEVITGPYFGGKIEVEDKFDKRCTVYGDSRSGRQIYKLTILHDVCGSEIKNESRIQTSIVVHENRELVTHSSRRFLVVCNFLPGTLTIQAAVQVPQNDTAPPKVTVKGQIADNNNNFVNVIDQVRTNNLRHARLLQTEEEAISRRTKTHKGADEIGQAILPLILTFAALVGIALWVWRRIRMQNESKAKSNITSLDHGVCSAVEVITTDHCSSPIKSTSNSNSKE